jgi:hypothetical protein
LKQLNRKETNKMKLGLLLSLLLACTLLGGSAMAQGCAVTTIAFPPTGGTNNIIKSGTCIASGTPGGTQTARLRWDNGGNGHLQLFDTDDSGQSLWCALDSTNHCAKGSSLCLQPDGNMVIYDQSGCHGNALWASNTSNNGLSNPICGFFGPDCNEDGERLGVFDITVNGIAVGESAVIQNDTLAHSDSGPQIIWFSNQND